MTTPKRPWWQQATALVSLSAGGAVTGFAFAPKAAAADIQSPSNMNIRLLALTQAAKPPAADDATLRAAIVNVATYYLRMAEGKSPAEIEQLIWQHDSVDGVDHGESCAAFASLTLELAAQVVGQQSWVSGGTSYPWPLHNWADVRVDPNPASPQIISVLQDAQAHDRWHPLSDGYRPLPGDWVLFNGHVEVVTKYADGVLSTIGGDSLPNLSVNAHQYSGSLAADGVVGFVNNGNLTAAGNGGPGGHARPDPGSGSGAGGQPGSGSTGGGRADSGPSRGPGGGPHGSQAHGSETHRGGKQTDEGQAPGQQSQAAIPGVPTAAGTASPATRRSATRARAARSDANAAIPGVPALTPADEQRPETRRRSAAPGRPRGDSGASTGQHDHADGQAGQHDHAGGQTGRPGSGGPRTGQSNGGAPRTGQPNSGGPKAGQPDSGGPKGGPASGGSSHAGPRAGGGPSAGQPGHGSPGAGRPADSGSQTGRAAHGGPSASPSTRGWSEIPGVPATVEASADKPAQPAANPPTGTRISAPAAPAAPVAPAAAAPTSAERTFIEQIAPGAMAAQRKYGVPAAVTIAQAIVESGWGNSTLAAQDHNLFGVKGTGPAGGALYPTTEYVNGRPVTRTAEFRVYHDVAQSIDDHGKLLADSGYYGQAMANRHDPDAFANSLTGVYATDPSYGTKIIATMRQYHLYRFDAATSRRAAGAPAPGGSGQRGTPAGRSGSAGSGPPASAAPGAGQVGVASIPGLPLSVSPERPTPGAKPPATRPPKPTTPISTPPASPAPGRTPPGTGSPTPTGPTSKPPASPAPTQTGPAKNAPTNSPPSRADRPAPSPSQSLHPAPEAAPTPKPIAYVKPAPSAHAGRGRAARQEADPAPASATSATQVDGRRAPARAAPSDADRAPEAAAPSGTRRSPEANAQLDAYATSALGADRAPPRATGPDARRAPARADTRPARPETPPARPEARPAPAPPVAASAATTPSAAKPSAGARSTTTRLAATRAAQPGATAAPATPPQATPPQATPPQATPPRATPPRATPPRPTQHRTAPPNAAPQRAAAPRTRPSSATSPSVDAVSARRPRPSAAYLPPTRASSSARPSWARHRDEIPPAVRNSFNLMAKAPLMARKSIYQDVASHVGVGWQILAACDWMQCKADARHSPVHGEKLGTANRDGTMYRTKSEALEQCAEDLIEVTWDVYEIDLPGQAQLSIADLANTFAAFRWGGLLRLHHTSAMEFPYSVAGLTEAHLKMRWPNIDDRNTPDKPAAKFRMPFGAVPAVLMLNYPAVD